MIGAAAVPAALGRITLSALALLLGVFGVAATPAPPEVYFEQSTVVRTDGVVQGAGVASRVWYAGSRMRLEAGDAPGGPALVLRLDLGKAWRLDPEKKVATEIDGARLRARSQMDASLAGDLMGGIEEGGVRTAPLKTPRTIAGHACRGFRITGPSVVMDLYVADDLPIGVDAFTDFVEWSGAAQSMGGILAEVRKLPGFPLLTRSRVTVLDRVHETVSTITKVQVGPQPRALFEVPPGYKVVVEAPDPDKE
jgi:uncharacterized protein DUF4412